MKAHISTQCGPKFLIVPLLRICVALERPSWSYRQDVRGRGVHRKINATRPSSPVPRGVYPILTITSPKFSKWGRRIIIQRKYLQHPHLLLLFQQQIYLLGLILSNVFHLLTENFTCMDFSSFKNIFRLFFSV